MNDQDHQHKEMTNNGLAGLFSAQFVAGALGFFFTLGFAYNAIQAGQESNKELLDKHDQAIQLLEQSQISLITDSTRITTTQGYILEESRNTKKEIENVNKDVREVKKDLDRVKSDINEILRILKAP